MLIPALAACDSLGVHLQRPPEHEKLVPHATLQPPQWRLFVSVLTQTPPQSVNPVLQVTALAAAAWSERRAEL